MTQPGHKTQIRTRVQPRVLGSMLGLVMLFGNLPALEQEIASFTEHPSVLELRLSYNVAVGNMECAAYLAGKVQKTRAASNRAKPGRA